MAGQGSVYLGPLDLKTDRAAFTCGKEPPDRYFRQQVSQDVKRRVASCFVLITEKGAVAGYYTLSATAISLSGLPDAIAKELPRYPVMPAALMGRLAVDQKHRGRRHGETLLFDAFNRVLKSQIATFAFVVDPIDDEARTFYEHYEFLPLLGSGARLFKPMAEIEKLFA